jgi:hypothetical protein
VKTPGKNQAHLTLDFSASRPHHTFRPTRKPPPPP